MASAQDDEFEQVIVTGSRIARPDFDSASPIVSVTRGALRSKRIQHGRVRAQHAAAIRPGVRSSGFLDGLRIGIGVENVTDEAAPIFPSFVQANTDPSQYDVFGRRYYASLRYSF